MKNIYGIDLRSIAAFRISLSLFIALEFCFSVLGNFKAIYSPETGVLGNAYATEYMAYYKGFSCIFYLQSDAAMLFFIYLIITVLLLLSIGFYSRLMAITGVILMYLFFNRYSILYFGWEMYAAVMLFWLAIVPHRTYFSIFNNTNTITNTIIDTHSSSIDETGTRLSFWGSIKNIFHYPLNYNNKDMFEWKSPIAYALIFQIGIIYFYNGISKNGALWMSGQAVESFLNETAKATSLAAWLLHHLSLRWVLVFLTYFTLAIEIALLAILFFPFKNKGLRFLAAFLIFFLHWGISLFADVGNFKYVATAVSFLLLPSYFWDSLFGFIKKYKEKQHSHPSKVIFLSFKQKLKSHRLYNLLKGYLSNKKSFVNVEGKPILNKDKAKKINTRLQKLQAPLLNIAKQLFYKRFAAEKIIAILLCCMILFSNLSQTNASETKDRMKHLITFFNLDKMFGTFNHTLLPQYTFFTQYWHLYSPDPPSEKGYMQLEAITKNKDTVSVFNGLPLGKSLFYSKVQEQLFSYLTLKKGRNKKDLIAEKQLLLREIKLWNTNTKNPKLMGMELVIYKKSRLKGTDKMQNPMRLIYKSVDIKYR